MGISKLIKKSTNKDLFKNKLILVIAIGLHKAYNKQTLKSTRYNNYLYRLRYYNKNGL